MSPAPIDEAAVADPLLAAREAGRICALATKGQRDLQRCVADHSALFPARPFDAALLANIGMAIAFIAPWCTPDQLRIANRTTLWGFATDWQIDYLAESADEVDRLVADCLAVADGATPAGDDLLGGFLAELRDELAGAGAFRALREAWRGELNRMLTAMAREWRWKSARGGAGGALPTLDEYLDNADNLGCTFVNLSHWVYTGELRTPDDFAELAAAGAEVQRIVRLVNDLGTYERDLRWGDLNAVLLVPGRDEIVELVSVLTERARRLLDPVRASLPRPADYLERQIGFTGGFYQSTDFWGVQ